MRFLSVFFGTQVYTGDTTFNGFLRANAAFQRTYASGSLLRARTLIIEATYLDGEVCKAADRGHVHLLDIAEHAGLFEHVQALVLVHLSQKYSLRCGLIPVLLYHNCTIVLV
jgi:ribonuclease BN (tRNA processing enzyme)